MFVRGRSVALENCPIERVSFVFNSKLNLINRIPCTEVPGTVLPILDS